MKHKQIDLKSEVKRATLPDGLHGFLFPLFEAVSNSFHSVEERWGEDVEGQGRIDVDLDVDRQQISVVDNGIGFNDANLDAFLTPLTGNKFERGGKGFAASFTFKSSMRFFTRPGRAETVGSAAAAVTGTSLSPAMITSSKSQMKKARAFIDTRQV